MPRNAYGRADYGEPEDKQWVRGRFVLVRSFVFRKQVCLLLFPSASCRLVRNSGPGKRVETTSAVPSALKAPSPSYNRTCHHRLPWTWDEPEPGSYRSAFPLPRRSVPRRSCLPVSRLSAAVSALRLEIGSCVTVVGSASCCVDGRPPVRHVARSGDLKIRLGMPSGRPLT